MEKIVSGVLGSFQDNIDERDFQIGSDEIPQLVMQDDIKFTRNQYINEWSKMDCTIFSNMFAACSTCNYEANYDDFKNIHDISIKDFLRTEGFGRTMPPACKAIRLYLSSKGFNLNYFRTLVHSEQRYKFCEFGYNYATTFSGGETWNKDRYDNNIIDNIGHGKTVFKHAIGGGFDGVHSWFVDDGREPKKYMLKDHKLLIASGEVNPRCYFWVDNKKLKKTPEQYKLESYIRILEKSIGSTQKFMLENMDKLQGQEILKQIIPLNADVNPLNRNWLAYVLAS